MTLAELLGDLPLALEEAAAYLEETGVGLGEYLGLVRDRARGAVRPGPAALPTSRTTSGGWRRCGRCRWTGSARRHRPPRRC